MHIKSMDLAWIVVSDIKQAEHFYTTVLGLTVSSRSDEHGWLEFKAQNGEFILGVCQFSQEHAEKAGQNAVLTMTVENIVKAKTELETQQVQFHGEIIEVPGHVKMATFTDKDGNKFQLVEQL